MIRTGDTIQNPVPGERITFLATARDTDGEAVVIETVVQPDGFVAATHVHPSQSERFAVAAGAPGPEAGGHKPAPRPGGAGTGGPRTPPRFSDPPPPPPPPLRRGPPPPPL